MEPAHAGRSPGPGHSAIFLLLTLLLLLSACARDRLIVPRTTVLLPADGRTHQVTTIARSSGRSLPASQIESASPEIRFVPHPGNSLAVLVRAPVLPGPALLHFSWHAHRYNLAVRYFPSSTDSHQDGLPDALHLHSPEDRAAFRAWFVVLAEQEAAVPDDKLPTEIDDCAALLRFAYREALVQHDDRWIAAQPDPTRFTSLVSIAQYHYPQTPLGLNLFRVTPGPFTAADLDDNGPASAAFAQFADAHALLALNTYLVSRDVHNALPGDLLFFRQLEQNSQYHSMIIAGTHADWVIYHTGPIGKQKGEIRRVSIEDLLHHPDARWRPVPGNTNFLGVYRWNTPARTEMNRTCSLGLLFFLLTAAAPARASRAVSFNISTNQTFAPGREADDPSLRPQRRRAGIPHLPRQRPGKIPGRISPTFIPSATCTPMAQRSRSTNVPGWRNSTTGSTTSGT